MIWSGYEKIEVRSSLVVLLIHMHWDFCQYLPTRRFRKLIAAQKGILNQCAQKGIPLVSLEYAGSGEVVEDLRRPIQKVQHRTRVIRNSDDGFEGEDCALNNTLTEIGAKTLVMMGVNASGCVMCNASSAMGLGYKVETSRRLITDTFGDARSACYWWYRDREALFELDHLSIAKCPPLQTRLTLR